MKIFRCDQASERTIRIAELLRFALEYKTLPEGARKTIQEALAIVEANREQPVEGDVPLDAFHSYDVLTPPDIADTPSVPWDQPAVGISMVEYSRDRLNRMFDEDLPPRQTPPHTRLVDESSIDDERLDRAFAGRREEEFDSRDNNDWPEG